MKSDPRSTGTPVQHPPVSPSAGHADPAPVGHPTDYHADHSATHHEPRPGFSDPHPRAVASGTADPDAGPLRIDADGTPLIQGALPGDRANPPDPTDQTNTDPGGNPNTDPNHPAPEDLRVLAPDPGAEAARASRRANAGVKAT